MIRSAASHPAPKRTSLPAAALLATVGVALAAPDRRADAPATQPTPPASDAALSTAQVRGAEAEKAADPVAADALKLDPVHASGGDDKGEEPAAAAARRGLGLRLRRPRRPGGLPAARRRRHPGGAGARSARPRAAEISGDTDPTLLRGAIDLYRKGRVADGDRMRDGFTDPAAKALLEWVAIRAGAGIGFNRTVAFARANPDWPAGPLLRRRAEEALLSERKSPATVRAFFATAKPSSAPGKFALALALRAEATRPTPPRWSATSGAPRASGGAWRPRCSTPSRTAHPGRPPLPDGAGAPEGRLGERRPGGGLRGRLLCQPRARPPGRRGQVLRRRRRARRGAAVAAQRRLLHLLPGAVFPPGRQARGRRRRARRGAGQPGRLGRRRRVVDRAPDRGAQAPRPRRRPDRLRGGERPGGAHAREADRGRVPRRLDRPALRRRSGGRRAAFRPGGGIAESPISVARAAYWQGRAAEALGQARRRNASTSARPCSRSPITARWPGRGSARPACPCGRRPISKAPSARPSRGGSTSAPCACSARPGSRISRCRSTSTPPGTCPTRANCRRSATSPPT